MQLIIIKGDITTIECDAIISSTNSELVPSGDIDTAVHSVAGPALTKACAKIAHCEVGSCVVTDGYNLPCKYVIHTVAPYAYEDSSAHLLAQCYKNSIKRAVHKGCTSIAFPLIGSGNKGFSTKKALDVALNRLEVCMRSESGDFTIYLVLFDDETKSLAMLRAKELIDEKYLAFGDDGQVDGVLPVDKRWISLCKVNRPDKNKDIWMQRLADSIGGTLVAPAFDEAKEKIFDNRPLIFCDDGPNDPDNIGFWEWTERQTETGRWLSDATYIEQPTPIEIIILDKLSSIGEVVEALKTGLHIPAYVRCSVLFAVKKDTDIEGVLCDLSNFNTRPGNDVFITIKNNIYTLPYYELSEHDIFTWKYRKIYKHISLNEPQKRIPVYALAETIKQMLLQRMSWPVFKAQGISKSDWQKFKQFLSEIPKDSILEKLSEMYDMSPQEAQACVESFLQTVENYVHAEDVDSTLIVQMLDNHKGLKQTCDEFAYKKWCGEHKVETEKAKEEVVAIRAKAEQEAVAAKQRLLDIEKSISSAEAKRNNILSEITTAQSRLDQLHTEIEQYEALGKDTLAAVRQKISDAQKDMAGFIADLSVILPQSNSPATPGKRVTNWQYSGATDWLYSEDDIDLADNWEDELYTISHNLVHSAKVENELCSMLAAFIYAAHINNVPLLIAGPGGHDMADALSASIYTSGAGQLTLCNECDYDVADEVAKYDEPVVSVQNMFGKGWADVLPQAFSTLGKHIIWTHPYVEDLAIEPKGLYNYMLPVLSECFVGIGAFPATIPTPGKRADGFKGYSHKKKQPLRIAAFKRLGLSKLLTQQLEIVLTDAKAIMDNPAKDKDMEVLFGMLPLCVLTGRVDILKDVIETESGISNSVQAEVARYIEEE